MSSFKAWFRTSRDGNMATNQLAFATEEEAETYAKELSFRWTSVVGWEVRPSEETPNYQLRDGMLAPIPNQEGVC